tara:strand:- start:1 stop:177 length:177 start_codon:yes stop_codon:yes gene_type:complete
LYNYDTIILKKDGNKQYIKENKYKNEIISTNMVLNSKKTIFYRDFLIAEIVFFGTILK